MIGRTLGVLVVVFSSIMTLLRLWNSFSETGKACLLYITGLAVFQDDMNVYSSSSFSLALLIVCPYIRLNFFVFLNSLIIIWKILEILSKKTSKRFQKTVHQKVPLYAWKLLRQQKKNPNLILDSIKVLM
ncbi:hypothetical protein CDAR_127051 [Caerostris darwini]|uniref:Uncharacterized protein n=1 Tax=Caerostris darwini TaxID=1538125 RepID=A0AAV4X964_9ARAC|nr:hypothetical protein CDAR_127051 [Caerostris darwini]